MIQLRRFIGMTLLAVGVALAQVAAPALAAGPSGTFFVGECSIKNTFPDLPSAVEAADALPRAQKKTITVCGGDYQDATTVAITTDNLTIKANPHAVITVPNGWAWDVITATDTDKVTIQNLTIQPGAAFTGNAVVFTGSTNVLLQKLVIDGQGRLGGGSSTAISFQASSGQIMNNKVLNWHTPDFNSFPHPLFVNDTGVETLKVSGNTISAFQGIAMDIEDMSFLTVSKNKITESALNPNPADDEGISVGPIAAGSVTGNQVTGLGSPGARNTYGIAIIISNGLKVSGNQVSHWETGIQLQNDCLPGTSDANKLTGNRINEVAIGIVMGPFGETTPCNEQADRNVITGNKIVDKVAQGMVGIQLIIASGGTFFGTGLNEKVTGNTITHFLTGVTPADPANHITGVFKPNTIKP